MCRNRVKEAETTRMVVGGEVRLLMGLNQRRPLPAEGWDGRVRCTKTTRKC